MGHQLRILHSIRRITRSVDLYSKHVAARHGVTLPQLVALLAVCESGPLTVTQLGKLVHLSPSTLIGIIDRLEEKGLLHRERSGVDRRAVFLIATEKAHTLSHNAPSPLQQSLVTAMEALPEEEQSAIAGTLERLVDLMESRPEVRPNVPLHELESLSAEVAPEEWGATSREEVL